MAYRSVLVLCFIACFILLCDRSISHVRVLWSVVTSEVDDGTVHGLNITCGAQIHIDAVTISAVSTVGPMVMQTTRGDLTETTTAVVSHSKSSPPTLARQHLYAHSVLCIASINRRLFRSFYNRYHNPRSTQRPSHKRKRWTNTWYKIRILPLLAQAALC